MESQNKKISDVYDRYDGMLESFVAMVRGDKDNSYSYEYELNLYKTVYEAGGRINE